MHTGPTFFFGFADQYELDRDCGICVLAYDQHGVISMEIP